MTSITHEATIKLTLDFAGSAALTKIQKAIDTIGNALSVVKAAEHFEKLQNTIAELETELKQSQGTVAGLQDKVKGLTNAQDKLVNLTKRGAVETETMNKAQARLADAQTRSQRAQDALAKSTDSTAKARERAARAEDAQFKASSRVAQAYSKVKKASRELASAETAQTKARAALQKLFDAGVTSGARLTRAQENMASANKRVTDAQEALTKATKQYDTAQASYGRRQTEVANAHKAVEKAMGVQEQRSEALAKAEKAVAIATDGVSAANTRAEAAIRKRISAQFRNLSETQKRGLVTGAIRPQELGVDENWRKYENDIKAVGDAVRKYGVSATQAASNTQRLSSEVKELSAEQKAAAQKARELSERLTLKSEVTNRVIRTTVTNKALQEQLKQVRAQVDALDASEEKNIGTLRALDRQLDSIIASEKAHAQSMQGSLRYRLSYYEKQVDAVYRASYRLAMSGSNLQMLARRTFDFGRQFMDTFGEYEFMLNRAAGAVEIWNDSQVEGVDGTRMLSDSVLSLARDLRIIPAQEVAEAFYYWGSATGVVVDSTEKLTTNMEALENIMKISIMTNTGYEDTIKGVYSILTQFYHGSIAEAGEVTQKLFLITQKTALEFNDLIQSFKMVGPVAAQAGASFDSMVTLLGRLGDLGIRGSMAGRAFRQMFIQMARPSGPAKKAITNLFTTISANLQDVTGPLAQEYRDTFGGKSYLEIMFPKGEFVGTEKYIRNLALAVDTLTQAERAAFLGRISTANELPVLTALVADEINKMHGLAKTAKNTADLSTDAAEYTRKNWERFSSSWKALVGTLERSWERVKIVVGGLISKALGPFIEKIREIIESIGEWANDPASAKLIQWFSKLAAATAIVTGLAGAVLSLMGMLAGLGASAYLVVNAFGRYVPGLIGFTGAAAALISGLIRNFDGLRSAVNDAFNNISSAVGDGVDVMQMLSDMVRAILEPLNGMIDLLFGLINVLIRLSGTVISVVAGLKEFKTILELISYAIGFVVVRSTLKWVTTMVQARLAARALAQAAAAEKMAALGTNAVAAAAGMGRLSLAMRGVVGLIGGPVGIIALVGTLGAVAYEIFPPFKDFIDGIASNFRNANQEARDFLATLGEMSGDISAGFGTLAVSERLRQFSANLTEARRIVAQGQLDARSAPSGMAEVELNGEKAYVGSNVDPDTREAIAVDLARRATPSEEEIVTAYTESLRAAVDSVNATRMSRGLAPITNDLFGKYIAAAAESLEGAAPTLGPQDNFARAITEKVMTTLPPTASREEIAKAIEEELMVAWNPETIGRGIGITIEDIQAEAWRAAGVYYDPIAVSKKSAAEVTRVWGSYAMSVVEAIEGGASQQEVIDMMTRYFSGHGGKGGGMVGTFSEVILKLDEETQKRLNEALQGRFGADAETILGSDTVKSLKAFSQEKWNALAYMAQEALYAGYKEAESATDQAYGDVMLALADKNFASAAESVRGIAKLLADRSISPEAFDAWKAVIETLVANDAIENEEAQQIIKGLEPKIKADTRTTIQIIKDELAVATEQAFGDGGVDVAQSWLLAIGKMLNDLGNPDMARRYFRDVLIPNIRGKSLDSETIAAIEGYARVLFPDIPLAQMVAPLRYQANILGQKVNKVIDFGIDLIGEIYSRFSSSGTVARGQAAIAAGMTIANNSNPAYQAGFESINNFFDMLALGTDEGYMKALEVYARDIRPTLSKMPSEIQEVIKSGVGTAEGQLHFKMPLDVMLDMQGVAGPISTENAAKTRRQWAEEMVASTIPTEKDLREALKNTPSGHKRVNDIFNFLGSDVLRRGLTVNSLGKNIVSQQNADQAIMALYTQFNASPNSRTGRRILRNVTKWINDPKTPAYIAQQLSRMFGVAMNNVEVTDPTATPDTGKKDTWLDTILKTFGIGAQDTSKDKPANVWLRVHISKAPSVNKTTAAVEEAKTKIQTALDDIEAMDWANVGQKSASLLLGAFLNAMNVERIRTRGWEIRGALRDITWYSGGQTAGGAWARGFNQAVLDTIDKTLTFVASVTIGNSPPPKGPLSDLDKGGANAGTAWADAYGRAARDRLLKHAEEMRSRNYQERVALMTEERYDAKKTIDIHLDVTSKDGSVDRAKQGEFRRGMMDVLVAADLEHYVTVG